LYWISTTFPSFYNSTTLSLIHSITPAVTLAVHKQSIHNSHGSTVYMCSFIKFVTPN
jgi:hypothetical protein